MLLASAEQSRGADDFFQQVGALREAVALRVVGAVRVPLQRGHAACDHREHALRGSAAVRLHEAAHFHRVPCGDAACNVAEVGLELPDLCVAIRGLEDHRGVCVAVVELMPVEARSIPARRRPLHRVERDVCGGEFLRRLGVHLRGGVSHEAKRPVVPHRVGCARWCGGHARSALHFFVGGNPDVERLHVVPLGRADFGERHLVRAQVFAELLRAALAADDVILRIHADLIIPQRPRFACARVAMPRDGRGDGLLHQRLQPRIERTRIGLLIPPRAFREQRHRLARARRAPENAAEILAHARHLHEAHGVGHAIHAEQPQRAAFVGEDGGIAVAHAVARCAAEPGHGKFAVAPEVADHAEEFRHRRRIGKKFLQCLAACARVSAEAVELRDEFGIHRIAERRAGKGKADRRALRCGLGEFFEDPAALREFKLHRRLRDRRAGLRRFRTARRRRADDDRRKAEAAHISHDTRDRHPRGPRIQWNIRHLRLRGERALHGSPAEPLSAVPPRDAHGGLLGHSLHDADAERQLRDSAGAARSLVCEIHLILRVQRDEAEEEKQQCRETGPVHGGVAGMPGVVAHFAALGKRMPPVARKREAREDRRGAAALLPQREDQLIHLRPQHQAHSSLSGELSQDASCHERPNPSFEHAFLSGMNPTQPWMVVGALHARYAVLPMRSSRVNKGQTDYCASNGDGNGCICTLRDLKTDVHQPAGTPSKPSK